MQNDKSKMQNGCVRFADLFKSFPKEIQQFCIFHFALCISCVSTLNSNFAANQFILIPILDNSAINSAPTVILYQL